MEKGKLGVIGGMGPQATLQFCQRILDHTAAGSDQEHLPMLILNDTQMPDRTAALFSGDVEPVCARLLADARVLEDWGPPPSPSPAIPPTPSCPGSRGS